VHNSELICHFFNKNLKIRPYYYCNITNFSFTKQIPKINFDKYLPMNYSYATQLNNLQKQAIMYIWNDVYPAQLAHTTIMSFEKYLTPLKNEHHILVQDNVDAIVGWFVTFDRQQERWFAMLLADQIKGQGIGSELLRQAKAMNKVLNGWVVAHNDYKRTDGACYRSPLGFYVKNEFEVLEENRLEDPKLSVIQVRWELGKQEG